MHCLDKEVSASGFTKDMEKNLQEVNFLVEHLKILRGDKVTLCFPDCVQSRVH